MRESGNSLLTTGRSIRRVSCKWAEREASDDPAEEVTGFSGACEVVDLDTAIALEAATLSAEHELSTADAIIYATALACGADLLTCDSHFQGLPGVRYVPRIPH